MNITDIMSILDTGILGISALLVYKQIRIAVKARQLEAMIKIDEYFEQINVLAREMYNEFPPEIVLSQTQFFKRPPYRFKRITYSDYEKANMRLTEAQEKALCNLTEIQYQKAKRVIELLNSVGQYIEDGFIDYNIVLGKYHTTIIRLCAIVEAVRRDIEAENKKLLGGNYGQRILRLRHKAILYIKIHEKHREVGVKLNMKKANKGIDVLSPIENTYSNKWKCFWLRIEYLKKYR